MGALDLQAPRATRHGLTKADLVDDSGLGANLPSTGSGLLQPLSEVYFEVLHTYAF